MQQLLKSPIDRGCISSSLVDWITVRSDQLHQKTVATAWLKGPHNDWDKLLGSFFLSYVTEGFPDCFQCL
jgi:hypothetical protein